MRTTDTGMIPDEHLHLSAPLARSLASTHCTQDGSTDCQWYHGYWQYFRLLGAVSSAREHSGAWMDTLVPLISEQRLPRVLLSGSSDFALLACAIAAYRRIGRPGEFTVLDLCKTPLALSDWYADQHIIKLSTANADILTYESGLPFDLILAHAFLGNFPQESRFAAVKNWKKLLRPGGKVALIQRIRPGCKTDIVRFTAPQALSFQSHIKDAAWASEYLNASETEHVSMAARIYTEKFSVYAISSIDEFMELFVQAGFRIEDCSTVNKDIGRPVAFSGPSVNEDALYLRLIATAL